MKKYLDFHTMQLPTLSIHVDGHDKDATINFHANDGLKVKVSAYASVSVTPGNITK